MWDDDAFDREFDRHLRTTRRTAVGMMVFSACFAVAITAAIFWILIEILQHCGIL